MRTPAAGPSPPRRRRIRPGMGCAGAAVLLLAGLLIGGHVVFRKGVEAVTARAIVRLHEVPAPAVGPERRRALDLALERWFRGLPRGPRGEEASGRFLALAQAILEDGRLDPDEAARLERFLAEAGP